jgi:predicted metal-dependent hydrolase
MGKAMASTTFPVRIHQQNRRSMVMKLTPVGVVVFIPRYLREDHPLVRAFIEQGLNKLGNRALPDSDQTSPRQLRALVDEWAARIGVEPGRVQLRDMYRKWGSCSSAGNITLNTALCRVPRSLAEYVVCHELVHLKVFNHGKAFKAMMSDHMPDWREREQALSKILGAGQVD